MTVPHSQPISETESPRQRCCAVPRRVPTVPSHSGAKPAQIRGAVAIAISCLLALAASTVQASPLRSPKSKATADAERSQLEAELRAAERALAENDAASAYRLATAAFRRDPSPEVLYLLGRVALAQGRRLDAQDLMRRFLADPGLDLAADAPEARAATQIVAEPAAESAQLNILGDREAQIVVDGRLVGRLPLSRPLLLSPATHKIEIVRGERRIEDSVRVPLGRLAELRCDLSSRTSLLSILPTIVLLPLTLDDGTGQAALLRMLEDAMAKARVAPLRADLAFALAGEPAPDACPDARRCALALAQSSEADYLLQLATAKDGSRTSLHLAFVDGQVGELAAQGERTCPACTVEVAGAQLIELFTALYDQARKRPRSRLELHVEPGDAQVFLDDRGLGPVPFSGPLFAGTRQLVVKKDGYQDVRRSVELNEGQTTRLDLSLVPEPEPAPAPLLAVPQVATQASKRSTLRLILGGSAIAGGAVLLGYGISGLLLNNRCEDLSIPISDNAQCPQIYKTGPPGAVLLGFGIALSGAGVLLMALPAKKPRPASQAAGGAGGSTAKTPKP